jgi:hypothetical protein
VAPLADIGGAVGAQHVDCAGRRLAVRSLSRDQHDAGLNFVADFEDETDRSAIVVEAHALAVTKHTGASLLGVQDAAWRQVVPATPEPLPLPDKPSIAVLPFQNMSPDTEHEFFADGIAEDVITALSRYPSLFVIARNSSFTYKGRAVDVKQIGRELGVRYVLEGSLRKGPDIINQDVTCRFGLYESIATGGDREIGAGLGLVRDVRRPSSGDPPPERDR